MMKLTLFYQKSVHENAARYYELAKQCREKITGLEKAIEETKKEIGQAGTGEKKEVRVKREKEWFEKFNHSITTSGRLMIGGRNAQQNDMVVSRHMDENDLFFHADIQGGSAVILKDGVDAGEEEMTEAAQYAASFSKAWANANASVDVYAVRKEQLSKAAPGGFIPTGAFAITGKRIWFYGTQLTLRIGIGDKGMAIVPDASAIHLKDELKLLPTKTGKEKGSLAKSLAKRFGVHPDELLEILPNGRSKTILG
jgi:predicted ribosome quality control (RQC) complex YloA/Tae2 family protein